MRNAPNQYGHPHLGVLSAITPGEYSGPVPAMADWVVIRESNGRAIGYIVDSRADGGRAPSLGKPAREEDTPFESYNLRGEQITSTHSVIGALLAVGNRA
jgi:hypothetical protein